MQTLNKVDNQIKLDGRQFKVLKNIIKKQKKNHIEVLNYVRIEVKNGLMSVTITNRGTVTTKIIEIDNKELRKTFLLPIQMIKDVKYIKNDSIYTLEFLDGSTLILNDSGTDIKIKLEDSTEYPLNRGSLSLDRFTELGTLKKSDYDKLKSANITTSDLESRPILRTVLIRENSVISTDSHRLYKSELEVMNTKRDIVIPKELVDKIIANETKKGFNADVYVDEKDGYTVIKTENGIYEHSLKGNYPDIDRLLPIDYDLSFTVNDVKNLKNTVQNINKIADKERNNVMKLTVIDEHTINLSASNVEQTKHVSVDIAIENIVNGSDFKISLSSQYLIDSITQLGTDKSLKFDFNGSMRPIIVTNEAKRKEISMVLPVRVFD